MSKLEIALFFHLLGALLFVAGIVVAGVAFEAARRRQLSAEIALLLGLTRVGVLLVVVGALDVLAFGLWLVDIEGVGYDAGWIQGALGLYTPQLRALLDDRLSLIANYASAVALLAILALMVFKPSA